MTTTVANQIRDLQSMPTAQLADRYAELFGKPPRIRHKAFLVRRCVWRIQEIALGGLPERAKARLEELIAQIDTPLRDPAPQRSRAAQRSEARAPMVGTTLIRRWHDQEIRVEVRNDGFEWKGALYGSLSAVAKAITGASWNGKLFFGLTKRRAGA